MNDRSGSIDRPPRITTTHVVEQPHALSRFCNYYAPGALRRFEKENIVKTAARTQKPTRPTRSPSRSPSRSYAPPPLWLRLLRKPIHTFLIALLLWPPQAWAAIAPAGGGGGSRERADATAPTELGGASDAAALGGDKAGDDGARDSAALSAKEATSGLDPDLEALIEDDEARDRREAQAGSSASDGGAGGGGEANPFGAALGSAPEVDLFSGSARLQVPLMIPPGRHDATPELNLVYSSGAGDSQFGYGWDLPLGHISRSTKWGVPTCPLNETDDKVDFILNINGSSVELKRMYTFPYQGGINHFYRARISEGFFEIWAATGERNYWQIFDRAGNQYLFGEVPAARLHSGVDTFYDTRYNADTGANCNFTTQWMLTRFISPNGNEIVYHYFKDVGNPAIYLDHIDYGGHRWNANLREAPFRIAFDRYIASINRDRGTPLNDPNIHPWTPWPRSISYARGVLQRRYYVITGIRVLYRPRSGSVHHLIRQYKLNYRDDPYTGRTFLQRVRTLDPAGRELAPPQTFEYASSRLAFAPETTVTGPLPSSDTHRLHYADRNGDTIRQLTDVNGDGYIDLIDSQSNGKVYLGSKDGITSRTFNWKGGFNQNTPLSDSGGIYTESAFRDMTGDGISDRVVAPWSSQKPWYIFPGNCETSAQCGEGLRITLAPHTIRPYNLREVTIGPRGGNPSTTVHDSIQDFNADGRPDGISNQPLGTFGSKTWTLFLNHGTFFRYAVFRSPFSYIESSQKHGDQHITTRMTMDVNGDRLPDHLVYHWNHCMTFDHAGNVVGDYYGKSCSAAATAFSIDRSKVVFANVVEVHLNSGRGFDHLIYWHLPSWGGGASSNQGIRRRLEQKQRRTVTNGGVVQDLRDMNGDGLPDFIEISGGKWRVTYNQGGVIDVSQNPTVTLPAGNWISQYSRTRRTKKSKYKTSTGIELFDMDGDSFPELVNAWNMNSWKVKKLRAPGGAPLIRPGLLVKAKNGLGGVAELQYRPSTRYDNTDTRGAPRLPQIHWVVSAIRQSDGLCDPGRADVFDPARNPCSSSGHDLITRYSYKGGLFDAASREFRGFRMVMATDPAGNDRKLYFSQADTTRGKVLREEQWVGNRLLSKTTYVWRTQQSHLRTQIYLAEQKQEEFDLVTNGAHNRCLLNRNPPPDDIGRVTTTCSLPCKGAPATPNSCANPIAGQIDTITTWANPNPTSWVRERPSHVVTRYKNAAGALETLVEKWFYYDGGKDGLPARQVLHGNVKRIVTKLDRSFAGPAVNPTVRNEYGAYGNMTATVDANGRRTVSDYRGSPFQLYPRVQRNALGHAVTTVTDLRYGQPTSVTGPNGQVTAHRYDALGRVVCLANPLDSIAGCGGSGPFTRSREFRYVYGNPKASGFQAKLSYVEERRREPWADGNAASHSAADYVAARQYSDALGRGRFQMQQRVIGASGGALQWVVEGQSHYNALGFVSATYVPYVLPTGSQVVELPKGGGLPATLFDYRFNGSSAWDPEGRPFRVSHPDRHPTTNYYGARRTVTYYPAPGRPSAAAPQPELPVAAAPASRAAADASFAATPAPPAVEAASPAAAEESAAGDEAASSRREAKVNAEDPPARRATREAEPAGDLAASTPSAQLGSPSGEMFSTGTARFARVAHLGADRLRARTRLGWTLDFAGRLHPPRGGALGAERRKGRPTARAVKPASGLLRAVTGASKQLRRLLSVPRQLHVGPQRQYEVHDGEKTRPLPSKVFLIYISPEDVEAIRRRALEREAKERAKREAQVRADREARRAEREARERAQREARERAAREARERAAREWGVRERAQRGAQLNAALRGSGPSNRGVTRVEDDFGREIYTNYFDPSDPNNVNKLWFDYRYDGMGRLLRSWTSGFDSKATVSTVYDTLGRPVQITDPDLGNGAQPGTVRMGYDAVGNLIYRDTPVARERVQWCHDALNRPKARFLRTDGDAYVASLCSNTATAETRYTYDSPTAGPYAKGRLARIDDAAGYATFVYDARGRVTSRTRSSPGPGGPRGGAATLTYAYDLADHVTALTYPGGEVVRSRYNRAGDVISVAGTSTYLKDVQYDFQGRRELIVHGNGTLAQPVVDDLNYYGAGENFRLREMHTKRGATSYYRVSYAYQEMGKIAKITDHVRRTGPLAATQAYTYDGLLRLVRADWLANGRTTDAYDAAYAFDLFGNLTQKGSLRGAVKLRFHATRPHQITSYGPLGTEHAVFYDAAGRMASRVVKTGATPAAANSESYFYDAADRMTRMVVHAGANRYVPGAAQESTTRYWYDAGGQRVRTQVTDGKTKAVSNTHHFFPEVEVRDGEMTVYYFAGGLRIAGRIVTPSAGASAGDLLAGVRFQGIELSPGVAIGLALVLLLLLLSPGLRGESRWRVLLVPSRALATAAFFWLAFLPPGLAKAALPGDVTLWHYHLDHVGTTHSITDASGNLYRQTRTTAYGEVRGRYDGAGNLVVAETALRHEFTGYESEEESGLQYAGARYYLPELGVFTSLDPEDQFPSPYAYGPGDPVNTVDPNGEFSLGAALLGLAIAGAVARAIYTWAKTGDFGLALGGLAVSLAAIGIGYAIGNAISYVLQKYAPAILTAAYKAGGTGYSIHKFQDAVRKGDVIGAVVGGLSIVASAYGRDPNGKGGWIKKPEGVPVGTLGDLEAGAVYAGLTGDGALTRVLGYLFGWSYFGHAAVFFAIDPKNQTVEVLTASQRGTETLKNFHKDLGDREWYIFKVEGIKLEELVNYVESLPNLNGGLWQYLDDWGNNVCSSEVAKPWSDQGARP